MHFKLIFLNLILLLFIIACTSHTRKNRVQVYYINKQTGNDHNNGVSPERAWKSIAKIESKIFLPGDSILFGNWLGGNGIIGITLSSLQLWN